MAGWVPLWSVCRNFQSDEEALEAIRYFELRLRGVYVIDQADPAAYVRTDPVEIARDFVLNSKLNSESEKLEADFANQPMDTSVFLRVEINADDFVQWETNRLKGKRGRPFTHPWELIDPIALSAMKGWRGSRNRFYEHLRHLILTRLPGSPIPSRETLLRRYGQKLADEVVRNSVRK